MTGIMIAPKSIDSQQVAQSGQRKSVTSQSNKTSPITRADVRSAIAGKTAAVVDAVKKADYQASETERHSAFAEVMINQTLTAIDVPSREFIKMALAKVGWDSNQLTTCLDEWLAEMHSCAINEPDKDAQRRTLATVRKQRERLFDWQAGDGRPLILEMVRETSDKSQYPVYKYRPIIGDVFNAILRDCSPGDLTKRKLKQLTAAVKAHTKEFTESFSGSANRDRKRRTNTPESDSARASTLRNSAYFKVLALGNKAKLGLAAAEANAVDLVAAADVAKFKAIEIAKISIRELELADLLAIDLKDRIELKLRLDRISIKLSDGSDLAKSPSEKGATSDFALNFNRDNDLLEKTYVTNVTQISDENIRVIDDSHELITVSQSPEMTPAKSNPRSPVGIPMADAIKELIRDQSRARRQERESAYLASLTIGDVIQSNPRMAAHGRRSHGVCPICGNKQCFNVDFDRGGYYCHNSSCGKGGYLRESWTNPPTSSDLAPATPRPAPAPRPVESKPKGDNRWRKWYAKSSSVEGTPGARYLESRSVPADLAAASGVKFCGWYNNGSIVYPIHDLERNLVAVEFRAVGDPLPDQPAKKAHGQKRDGVVFDPADLEADRIAIVENPLTRLILKSCGLAAIATCSAGNWPASLTDALPGKEVLLSYDNDEPDEHTGKRAGDEGEAKAVERLQGSAILRRFRPADAKNWLKVAERDGLDAVRRQVAALLDRLSIEAEPEPSADAPITEQPETARKWSGGKSKEPTVRGGIGNYFGPGESDVFEDGSAKPF